MEIWIKVGQLLLSLSILVVLHELGHFIPAKLFGTRVEKFYLFFDAGFSLFRVKRGDTEYGIGWIPLGGYVKLSGMVDESMDTKQLEKEPEPHEFRSKPAWQRLVIMVGGVTVNLLLGFFIYSMILYFSGERYLPNDELKDGVWVVNELGKEIGFETGDKILTVNGDSVERFGGVEQAMMHGGFVEVERNGQVERIDVPENLPGRLSDQGARQGLFAPRMPFFIAAVPDSSVNSDAGLKKGDRIVHLGEDEIRYFDQAEGILEKNAGKTLEAKLIREEDTLSKELSITPEGKIEVMVGQASPKQLEQLGIYTLKSRKYGFFESLPAGLEKATDKLVSYIQMFGLIFNPDTGAYKGVGGFGTIGSIFPASWDWLAFWEITAFLSLILAFMNILPIPALDGGHVMFLLYEMVAGRPPGRKFMEYAQMIGMLLLLALLLYANGMDLFRWLSG